MAATVICFSSYHQAIEIIDHLDGITDPVLP